MRSDFEIRRINKSLMKMYDDVSDRYVDKLEDLIDKDDEDLRKGVHDIINTWRGTE